MKNIYFILSLVGLISCKAAKPILRKLSPSELNRYMQLNPSPPKDIGYIDFDKHRISFDSMRVFGRKGTQRFKIDYYVDSRDEIVEAQLVRATEEELKAIQEESLNFVQNNPFPIIKTNCDSLKETIAALYKQDQEARKKEPFDGFKDLQNRIYAISLIENCGWDLIERSDKENIHSLFIIIQHANKYTRNKYFKKFEEYTERGYLAPKSLALMQDRMLMDNNQPQIYGTQIIVKNDKQFIWPIQNAKEVDARRLKIGLDSLSIYLKYFGLTYPKDLYDSK